MTDPFQTILITGATGSWGHAATTFLLRHTNATLRLFSRDENKQAQMAQHFGNHPRLRFFLGDVRDQHRLEDAMENVDLVFHAAALKHVPSGEYNIGELIRTNIIGTENVATVARRCNVGKVVFLSTDKSIHAINSYGASKAMAERIIIQANSYAPYGTEYCCVRYGNVHGSRSSVGEVWEKALRQGTPLTITDLTMSRFFLTLQEAVCTAWTAACCVPRGGILIPHIPAYTLQTLLAAMMNLAGKDTIAQVTIGARVGEKFAEELMAADELQRLAVYTINGQQALYYCIMPAAPTWETQPIQHWPVWTKDGQGSVQCGWWYKGGMDEPYNSGTWTFRLTTADLVARIQEAL